jgi:hypothetical protein
LPSPTKIAPPIGRSAPKARLYSWPLARSLAVAIGEAALLLQLGDPSHQVRHQAGVGPRRHRRDQLPDRGRRGAFFVAGFGRRFLLQPHRLATPGELERVDVVGVDRQDLLRLDLPLGGRRQLALEEVNEGEKPQRKSQQNQQRARLHK